MINLLIIFLSVMFSVYITIISIKSIMIKRKIKNFNKKYTIAVEAGIDKKYNNGRFSLRWCNKKEYLNNGKYSFIHLYENKNLRSVLFIYHKKDLETVNEILEKIGFVVMDNQEEKILKFHSVD